MKKIIYGLCLLLVIVSIVYLNRSYTSIYQELKNANLRIPSDYGEYFIGSSSESLNYVAIGDSLTSGVGVDTYKDSYPYILAELISQKNNITVNLTPIAIPGAQTSHVLETLIDEAFIYKPDVITLLVGVNDMHGNISVKKFRNNYKNILDRLTKETSAKIYIINVPYIGTTDLITRPYKNYFMYRTEKFNSVIKELAKEYNLEYIDLHKLSLEQYLDSSYYALDFFHLNKEGYIQWAKFIHANFNN